MEQQIITPAEAEARNLRPLTTACNKREAWILENVIADMKRGHIHAELVEVPGGVEVWRASSGWQEIRES